MVKTMCVRLVSLYILLSLSLDQTLFKMKILKLFRFIFNLHTLFVVLNYAETCIY